jgi:hypothetical protein
MKAISVKQPWAWALFHGKPVENRTWETDYRGELLIHASKQWDKKGFLWLRDNKYMVDSHVISFHIGCIIGKVTMTDCVISHPSPFFFGPYGHIYKDSIEFKTPIPFKGKLKFFDVPAELIKE